MSEPKTKPTEESVDDFLQGVDDARREDCQTLVRIMKQATGAEPKMWGSGMVGFGEYHYKYASGREGTWFVAGFSPRPDPPGRLSGVLRPQRPPSLYAATGKS